jgi:hypothetical protein
MGLLMGARDRKQDGLDSKPSDWLGITLRSVVGAAPFVSGLRYQGHQFAERPD